MFLAGAGLWGIGLLLPSTSDVRRLRPPVLHSREHALLNRTWEGVSVRLHTGSWDPERRKHSRMSRNSRSVLCELRSVPRFGEARHQAGIARGIFNG